MAHRTGSSPAACARARRGPGVMPGDPAVAAPACGHGRPRLGAARPPRPHGAVVRVAPDRPGRAGGAAERGAARGSARPAGTTSAEAVRGPRGPARLRPMPRRPGRRGPARLRGALSRAGQGASAAKSSRPCLRTRRGQFCRKSAPSPMRCAQQAGPTVPGAGLSPPADRRRPRNLRAPALRCEGRAPAGVGHGAEAQAWISALLARGCDDARE